MRAFLRPLSEELYLFFLDVERSSERGPRNEARMGEIGEQCFKCFL